MSNRPTFNGYVIEAIKQGVSCKLPMWQLIMEVPLLLILFVHDYIVYVFEKVKLKSK